MSTTKRGRAGRVAGVVILAAVAAAILILRALPRDSSSPVAVSTSQPTPPAVGPAETFVPTQVKAPEPGSFDADFTDGQVPPQFSSGKVSHLQAGKRPVLGWFNQYPVQLTITDMPPHELMNLTIDVALVNSWNGSSSYWGPDIWSCNLVGGPTLLHATFCNCGFFSNNNEQSFPDQFPLPAGVASYPAWTGAAERQTLGETNLFVNGDPMSAQDTSGVYHLDWTFPHHAADFVVNMQASNKNRQMRWGLLSVHAHTVPKLATMNGIEMASAYGALCGDDSVAASTAGWQLAATGDAAVDFLRSSKPVSSELIKMRQRHLLLVIDTDKSRQAAGKLDTQSR